MMEWLTNHWLAAVLLLLYTGVLLYNAYLGNSASKGLSGYMVGNRAMGGVVVGISFFATFASTNSYIGHAGKGYAYGFAWLTMAVLLVIFSWVSWRWVGPPMRRFASAWDALTIPDFLGSRFVPPGPSAERHPLRLAAAVVIAFSSLLYLLAIFKGAGHLFQFFLNVDYELAVGITLVIVMLYTSIGGFVSVVRTDVIQGLLMLIGSVMIFYFVTRAAGGISAVGELRLNPEKDFLFDLNGGALRGAAGCIALWFAQTAGGPQANLTIFRAKRRCRRSARDLGRRWRARNHSILLVSCGHLRTSHPD